jgi:hypothetical protein
MDMMVDARAALAAAAFCAATLSTGAARADVDEPPPEATEPKTRAGYFSFGARPQYELGRYSYATRLSPAFGGSADPIDFAATLHGPQAMLDFGFGAALSPKSALVVDVSLGGGPVFQDGRLGHTKVTAFLGARFGAFVDHFPDPKSGLHYQGGLAIAARAVLGGQLAIGTADNVVDLEPLFGPSGRVAIGYRTSPDNKLGVDLLARFDPAVMFSSHAIYVAGAISVSAGIIWF